MATNLEIVNMALAEIGDLTLTTYPDVNNRAATLCATHFSRSLDETLELHGWNEANARVTIATSSYSASFEYDQAYEVPSDNIDIISVNEEEFKYSENYALEGEYILANNDNTINVKYTKRINPTDMTNRVAYIFALVLAKNICMPLAANAKLKGSIIQMLEGTYIPKAKFKNDSTERVVRKNRRTPWQRARHRSASSNNLYYPY